MEAMEIAPRHHNKRILSSATRPMALSSVLIALALLIPVGAPAFGSTKPQEKSSGKAARQAQPEFDPYRARQDVNVGKFYKNKGKYDAAISRFNSAVKHDPRWSVPYKLLGETYEKKNDPKRAIAAYRKYLKIKPYAKDAKKIRKRIENLTRELKSREAENR